MGIHEEMPESHALWSLLLEAQAKRGLRVKKQKARRVIRCRRWPRARSIVMKRRASVEGSRRPANPIDKKIKTLKKLIPNPNNESMGLDGLFRETADYILALQMRVKVMQIMVNVLAGSDE